MNKKGIMEIFNDCKNVVIAGHTNPDGDAIGASLALAMALKKIGKNPWVVLEEYSEKYNVIPGREFIYKGSLDQLKLDTFIAVDCGSEDRLGKAKLFLEKAETTVSIDHHMSNTSFADLNFVDTMASSTSEMVFRLINNVILIDVEIASALYAGMVYDTGGFRHNSTTIETLNTASRLLSLGIPFSRIYNELMHHHDMAEAKILGIALEHLELLEQGQVAYTYISQDDLDSVGATKQSIGNVCEYALNTENAKVSVLIYHKAEGVVKVSMRAKNIFVNKIAEMLGGGGHEFAAGADFSGTIEQAKDKVMNLLRPML